LYLESNGANLLFQDRVRISKSQGTPFGPGFAFEKMHLTGVAMAQKKYKGLDKINEVSTIDLLLFDHQFIKVCLEVMIDDRAGKKKKMSLARSFLDSVLKHSLAEKKAVYAVLVKNEELHFNVLEAEVEHGIVDEKAKSLRTKIGRSRALKDEIEAELKVVAQLLKNHLEHEEDVMLPKMQETLDDATLVEMGTVFSEVRKFTAEELKGRPLMLEGLVDWKDETQRVSSQLLSRMDKYSESMKH
jgi:hemerythrin-like domain-containing protein